MASATATATPTDGSQPKIVMGHPVQDIPPSANFVMGNPEMTSSPPPVYLHQLFDQSSGGRRNRSYSQRRDEIILYRLTAAALVLLVAMSSMLFILLLILRPRLPQLQIASVDVSPFSTTNTDVSATCNVSILVTNPNNKLSAFYDSFRISLQYRTDKLLLSDVQIPPFAQPRKSDTVLHIYLRIDNANIGKDGVMAIKEDLGHGLVRFEFKIFSMIRLESKDWRPRSQVVLFYCPDLMLGFSPRNGSGYLTDRFKECQVAL